MQAQEPSRTALAAAFHRATHQVLEQGGIFTDPLALRILGVDAETIVREDERHPSRRRMRIFIAVRTRFAEDALAAAVERGVRQLVLLGAGLDTYAYRGACRDRLRIFEVDHPATQAWKRQRLADAAIPLPPSLTFAPIDFERQTLAKGLEAAGFDPAEQTFFTWLGVVPYLSEAAVFATLAAIAALPGGAQVVFDYGNPAGEGRDAYAADREDLARRVESGGEPLESHFETGELHARLAALGFGSIEDLGPAAMRRRFLPGAEAAGTDRGGHILTAGR